MHQKLLSCENLYKHVTLQILNFIPLTNENFSHIWNNVKLSFLLLNALLSAMKANKKSTVLLFILPR